jgi:hypothetical protein
MALIVVKENFVNIKNSNLYYGSKFLKCHNIYAKR